MTLVTLRLFLSCMGGPHQLAGIARTDGMVPQELVGPRTVVPWVEPLEAFPR